MSQQSQNGADRLLGFIQKVVEVRGYGFIRTDDDREHFFNIQDVLTKLPKVVIRGRRKKGMVSIRGKRVSFRSLPNPVQGKCPRAVEIEVLA